MMHPALLSRGRGPRRSRGAVAVVLPSEDRVDGMAHLHVHNEYSFLDGVGTSVHQAQRAREAGITALAITNHGNLSGVLHHLKACEAEGVKPILGMEAYFKPDRLLQDESNKKYHHLLLLARDMDGFRNLMRMSSESYESGFYYKPCVDVELLKLYGGGLIGSTSCLSGIIPSCYLAGDDPKQWWDFFVDVFRDGFFAEIQPHDIPELRTVNVAVVNEANRRGIPIVATSDAHYPWKEWADTQDVLLMARTGQTTASREKAKEKGEDYMSFTGDTFFISSRGEMREQFLANHPHIPWTEVDRAIDNTNLVSGWIRPFDFDKSMKAPKGAATPEEAEKLLRSWCEEGLFRIGRTRDAGYRERMEYELSVLRDKGVLDYFLVIGDVVRWAKRNGIRVGPGRGSAAGSLVSYLCRITCIDPIGHGFLFERFLNPARTEMPDIDIDFQHTRRAEVVEYFQATYGPDHVANVAAFQTYGMASAIQAVAKALLVPYDFVMHVTKTFDEAKTSAGSPDDEGEVKLEMLLPVCKPLQELKEKHPDVWTHALRIEGQVKTMGKHPAGIVITDKPISEYMPTMRSSGGQVVTAWSERANFPIITTYGFLKIDALSTDGLTVQQMAAELIERRHGKRVDFESVAQFPSIEHPDAVDPDVIGMFGEGRTLGVFQFGSHGITGMLKDIKPTSLKDVIAANALFRPGPLDGGVAFLYGARKNGKEQWSHFHPIVAPFLDETFGLIVYQEQVIQIVQSIGGLSPGDADFVRKAMTKWHSNKTNTRRGLDRMTQFEDEAVKHATTQLGLTKKEFEDVWNKVLQFSKYGFNKPHAGSYGLQAYMDMWLKRYYPLEFYTALLTVERGKTPKIVREAMNSGITILPPDVNTSVTGFLLDGDGIRFGLDGIKDVGGVAVNEIMAARPFKDYDDMLAKCEKRKLNSKVVKALTEAGALDRWGARDHLTPSEKAQFERERMKLPLTTIAKASKDADVVDKCVYTNTELEKMDPGSTVTVGGEITAVKELKTKKGSDMAFVEMEHGAETYRTTWFPATFSMSKGRLLLGQVMVVIGKLEPDHRTVLVDRWTTIEDLKLEMERGTNGGRPGTT